MDINLLHIEDLAAKSETEKEIINSWLKEGLFLPEGRASDSTPIFSDESLKTINKIKSLLELGYDTAEIKKIIKKVGLPAASADTKSQSKTGENYLTVGTLAEKTKVSARTIKHWEEKGIIEPDLRSQGGFRLYRDYYILFCNLIKDLQHFGYSLDEIKTISDFFRDFIKMKDNPELLDPASVETRLQEMEDEILQLFQKMDQLRTGMKRWEDLLKKQKKQITVVKEKNRKRLKKDIDNEK